LYNTISFKVVVVISFQEIIIILRMKKIFILSILSVFGFVQLTACSCLPIGNSFCQTINADTSIVSVIMAEKIANYHYGMRVKCLTVISGQHPGDTILVWGDNGILCRKATGNSLSGDTLILALQRCDMAGNTLFNPQYPAGLELATDYQLSVCGIYCLSVSNGIVQGSITAPSQQLLGLNQFLSSSCLMLGSPGTEQMVNIELWPNPAADQLFIQFAAVQKGALRIYNSAGQLMLTEQFYDARFVADLSRYPEGLYVVEVETDAFRVVKKVAVVR
jgi:Secretion system C-terminal sorting domain